MKKMGKKILITATVFTAAVNMNGCVYGPPPDGYSRGIIATEDRAMLIEETKEQKNSVLNDCVEGKMENAENNT